MFNVAERNGGLRLESQDRLVRAMTFQSPHRFGAHHTTKEAAEQAGERKHRKMIQRYPIIESMFDWMHERPNTPQETRWARALAVFGYNAHIHEPMKLSEAKGFANRGWKRWPLVVRAMREHLGE